MTLHGDPISTRGRDVAELFNEAASQRGFQVSLTYSDWGDSWTVGVVGLPVTYTVTQRYLVRKWEVIGELVTTIFDSLADDIMEHEHHMTMEYDE